MGITMHDIMPVGLCLATQELFDARRFRSNFADNAILRNKDEKLAPRLTEVKRKLNSYMTEDNFLEGHKTAIIGNMDKIMSLVARFSSIDLNTTETILSDSKELMERVLNARGFEEIAALEPEFKKKVTFPVYGLFVNQVKRGGGIV